LTLQQKSLVEPEIYQKEIDGITEHLQSFIVENKLPTPLSRQSFIKICKSFGKTCDKITAVEAILHYRLDQQESLINLATYLYSKLPYMPDVAEKAPSLPPIRTTKP
jgi:hypothetical protein